MRHLLELFLMIVAPFCLWYAFFMLICADWNIVNWHWAPRSVWVIISIWSMIRIFKKYK